MTEGLYAILNTDPNLYASLFDFINPWKIDILEFMEKNYMNELSMSEMAYYTGGACLHSNETSGNTATSRLRNGLSDAGYRPHAN